MVVNKGLHVAEHLGAAARTDATLVRYAASVRAHLDAFGRLSQERGASLFGETRFREIERTRARPFFV